MNKRNRDKSLDLSNYEGVRALVLGAGGFIGRSVARRLCQAGAEVLLHVRDRREAEPTFERCEITGDLYELDLYDLQNVVNLLHDLRPTITFNLAGYGIDRSETDEGSAYLINCQLPETVCQAVLQTRDRSWMGRDLVHTGTAMEYGMATGDLAEDTPAMPTTLYGRSKLEGTAAVMRCSAKTGMRGLTARLFGVYGPGEPSQRLLPMLIRESAGTDPIPLTAGRHERDLVYVDDVADGLLRLGLSSGDPGEVVNLASGQLTSIRSFVEIAAREIGIDEERLAFGMLPTRDEEMSHDPVTNRRLIDRTGWSPRMSIAEGVSRTLEFERSRVQTPAVEMVF